MDGAYGDHFALRDKISLTKEDFCRMAVSLTTDASRPTKQAVHNQPEPLFDCGCRHL
jgi:hypothetical protein